MTESLTCDVDELRTLFLFEQLNDEQLQWLCEHGHVEAHDPGFVFREGDPATCFYVLIEGELAMSKRSGGADIETNRTSQRGVYCGATGWFDADADRADLAVAIRTFSCHADGTGFGVGAGITIDSDPAAEWDETELKAARLLALAGARTEPALAAVTAR